MGLTAFVLQGLIKLDDSEFNKSLSEAEKKTRGFGEKLGGIGKGLATVGKAAAATVAAASVAVGKIVLDAVNAYSEYEQLVGGVETLFGAGGRTLEEYQKSIGITEKSTQKQIDASIEKYNNLQQAQNDMVENAHKAFATAGVDANTYMQNVTSFSASLIKSLNGDTVKAAKAADQAMIDMADNSNKMGTDLQSIQNAYQGFAKQNYTMLDNLKLGYGGTKTEMQRLLKDAEKIQKQQGKNVKYSLDNLADIYEAIHVVQTELGITGTTAEEAEKTIQGSTNMMKAAWTNLKIAMVSPNGNIPQAINDFTTSIKAAVKNWIPAIKQGLSGFGAVVKELAPILSKELSGLIVDVLPDLLSSAGELAKGLFQGIATSLPELMTSFGNVLTSLFELEWPTWDDVKEAAGKAWEAIKKGAAKLGGLIFGTKEDGSVDWPTWDDVKEKAGEVWEAIKAGVKELGGLIFGKKEDGSVDWPDWEDVKAAAEEAWKTIKAGVKELGGLIFGKKEDGSVDWPTWKDVEKKASEAWETIKEGAKGLAGLVLGDALESVESTRDTITTWIEEKLGSVKNFFKDILFKFPTWDEIKEGAKGTINSVIRGINGLFGTNIGEIGEENIAEKMIGNIDDTAETAEVYTKLMDDLIAKYGEEVVKHQEWYEVLGQLKTILPELSTPIEEYSGKITDLTGFIREQTEAWRQNAIEQALVQTMQEEYQKIVQKTKEQEEARRKVSKAQQETSEAATQAQEDMNNALTNLGKYETAGIATEKISDFREALDSGDLEAAHQALSEVYNALNEIVGADDPKAAKELFDIVNSDAWKEYEQSLVNQNNAQKELERTTQALDTATKNYEDTAKAAKERLDEVAAAVNNIPSEKTITINTVVNGPDAEGFAKGNWDVPYDNFPALLHRNEMVLTASQARRYREEGSGSSIDYNALAQSIVGAVREGMEGAQVNSYLDGKAVTDVVSRILGSGILARRFA